MLLFVILIVVAISLVVRLITLPFRLGGYFLRRNNNWDGYNNPYYGPRWGGGWGNGYGYGYGCGYRRHRGIGHIFLVILVLVALSHLFGGGGYHHHHHHLL